MRRELRITIILGSTTEEITLKLNEYFRHTHFCPGNLVDSRLYKLGEVYQLVLYYAEVVSKKDPKKIIPSHFVI